MSNLYSYLENIYSKLSNCCVIICKDYPDDTEVINKSIPNFRKLVCIFGGVMPQTRRRRSRRSSGDSTWPPQSHRTGGSLSQTAPPPAPSSVNWDDDMDDFMPPKSWPRTHDVPPPLHEPRTRKETKGKAIDSSSHVAPLEAQTCVNWDDDMDDFMPPNHGLQHMMFLPCT